MQANITLQMIMNTHNWQIIMDLSITIPLGNFSLLLLRRESVMGENVNSRERFPEFKFSSAHAGRVSIPGSLISLASVSSSVR